MNHSTHSTQLEEFRCSKNAALSDLANRLEKKRLAAVAEHQSFMDEHRRQFELVQNHAQNAIDKRQEALRAVEARHNRLKASLSRELDDSNGLLSLVIQILED